MVAGNSLGKRFMVCRRAVDRTVHEKGSSVPFEVEGVGIYG